MPHFDFPVRLLGSFWLVSPGRMGSILPGDTSTFFYITNSQSKFVLESVSVT